MVTRRRQAQTPTDNVVTLTRLGNSEREFPAALFPVALNDADVNFVCTVWQLLFGRNGVLSQRPNYIEVGPLVTTGALKMQEWKKQEWKNQE